MQKLDALRQQLRDLGSLVVCFSGGVDSAFVLAVAHEVLGVRALGMTAVSPALPRSELDACVRIAEQLGAQHRVVDSREIEDPRYAANPTNRCYFCKTELYRIARVVRDEVGFHAIANGVNLDDLGDYRPGLDAAREADVLSPLVDAGFTKEDVREGARRMGLEVWDKPASACLASRIPYGTAVTHERLDTIGRAEQKIRALGLRQIRVRLHDQLARVEVSDTEMDRAFALRKEIAEACREAGFLFATLDLDGYRKGSHNEVLRLPVIRA